MPDLLSLWQQVFLTSAGVNCIYLWYIHVVYGLLLPNIVAMLSLIV